MIEQLAYELETDLLVAIARHLKTGAFGSATWKIEKLGQLGVLNNHVREIINRYRARIILGIGDEIGQSAYDMLDEIKAALPKNMKGTVSMSAGLQNTVDAWISSASGQSNLALAKLAQNAGQTYVATVSKASLAVLSGAETHKEALTQAITEMKSITAFVDDAGRTWSPEGYISMVIRTNSSRVTNEVQFQAAGQLGTDLVEISAHAGARPLCAPYQGKIISLHGETPGYIRLADTSYGQPAGLFGINCGHTMTPFIPGVSEKAQSLGINSKENAAIYAESQEQRRLERQIRAAKREQMKFEAVGNDVKAKQYAQQVKDNQAKMREFIKETDRTRRYDREKVYPTV